MTVIDTTGKSPQLATDGIKVAFDFTFRTFSESDILVYTIYNGVATLKTITTDYTVALNTDGKGGTVTFLTAPITGGFVQMIRAVPFTQPTNLPVQGALPEGPLENAIDRSVLLNQQTRDEVALAVKLAQTTSFAGSLELTDPTANGYLGVSADGLSLEWKTTLTEGSYAIPAIATNGGKTLAVNSGETGLEWGDGPEDLRTEWATDIRASETKLYKGGPALEYVSATELKIPAGVVARDDGDAYTLEVASDITIDISTTTGAAVVNALMNGLTEAVDTVYSVWLIAKADGTDPAGLLTTSHTAISSFPTDYTLKRHLGYFVNDGSSNQVPFVSTGLGGTVHYYYQVNLPHYALTVGPTNILDGGTSTSYAAVSCAKYVPEAGQIAMLKVSSGNSNTNIQYLRTTGETYNGYSWTGNNLDEMFVPMKTGASNQIDYRTASGTYPLDLAVAGFIFDGGAK